MTGDGMHSKSNWVRQVLGGSASMVALSLMLAASLAAPASGQTQSAPAMTVEQAETLLWSTPGPAEIAAARTVLESGAEAGDPGAQYLLGRHLLNGWSLPRDAAQGLSWLEKSAAAGHGKAQIELGQAYLWGKAAPADPARAMALFETSAASGTPTARRILGEQLIGGWTLPRDADRGLALLDQAIVDGDIEAHVVLGKLLLKGEGVSQDRAAALTHFEAAATAGNGAGLAVYGEDLMWRFSDPARAESMLVRAGELGTGDAWTILAHGAMYGYLGGGSQSRAKFDDYAARARAAGQDDIAVYEATRNMWGINMRASGPETIARLRADADAGNAAAARFLIELLRDGNNLNLRRQTAEARKALEKYAPLLGEATRDRYALTIDATRARSPEAYGVVAGAVAARPDLASPWFGREMVKANTNVAIYILQQRLRASGAYDGPLDGFATRPTLRAIYRACLALDHPERCDDSVMRRDVIGDLLAKP